MADPVVNEEKKTGTPGVFGGGEDIFDNEELFQPVDGIESPRPAGSTDRSKVQSQESEEDLSRDENEDKVTSKEGGVTSEDESFDPIFTEVTSDEGGVTSDDEEKIIDENKSSTSLGESPPFVKEDNIIEKEPEEEKSDLMKKFGELINKTKELYEMAQMEDSQYVELVGGDTGKSSVIYNLWLIKEDENDSILISRIETDNETKDEEQNNLEFKNNNGKLEILLDEQLLYDEIEDLQDDQNKKMQVIDKLNKFIFLVSEELKIYERDRKEKERMELERRKLRDIFRNF